MIAHGPLTSISLSLSISGTRIHAHTSYITRMRVEKVIEGILRIEKATLDEVLELPSILYINEERRKRRLRTSLVESLKVLVSEQGTCVSRCKLGHSRGNFCVALHMAHSFPYVPRVLDPERLPYCLSQPSSEAPTSTTAYDEFRAYSPGACRATVPEMAQFYSS